MLCGKLLPVVRDNKGDVKLGEAQNNLAVPFCNDNNAFLTLSGMAYVLVQLNQAVGSCRVVSH